MFRPSGVRAREAVRGLQALAQMRDAIGNPFFSAKYSQIFRDKGLRFIYSIVFFDWTIVYSTISYNLQTSSYFEVTLK